MSYGKSYDDLTGDDRRAILRLKGQLGYRKASQLMSVSQWAVRKVWDKKRVDACNKRSRERRAESERRAVKAVEMAGPHRKSVSTKDRFRAKGLGDGKCSICGGCRKRLMAEDYETDELGSVIETMLCWRCRNK